MHIARVPSAITIVETSHNRRSAREFVVTNEATGRHFAANETTVRFIESLRRDGVVHTAATAAGLTIEQAAQLLANISQHGITTDTQASNQAAAPTAPIEGKLISVRADLLDVSRLARRLTRLGKALLSLPGALLWGALILLALTILARNGDKIATGFQQLAKFEAGTTVLFVGLFVLLKAFHELGHILAYRVMCLREDLNPGPIRVGIMVFAATPFPFTDVTGAWRIRSKWRRAMIGAAGMYFETIAVALLTLAWAAFDMGVLEPLILQVAVISGALSLLFNLNPAVKLDGYYILTDLTRQPNLAGRASRAARAWLARALGAEVPRPNGIEIGYWLVSYAYRWTIFAGIFWIAYRFDTRLASLVAIVTVMLLIVRPLFGALKAVKGKATPKRTFIASASVALFAALMFVPFQARLLSDGQMYHYRTDMLRAPEAARLKGDGSRLAPFTFDQPELAQDKNALLTRADILANLSRVAGLNAVESAALASDAQGIKDRLDELNARIARLTPDIPADAIVTPRLGETLRDGWVRTDFSEPLATISKPVPTYLKVRIAQNRLEQDLARDMRVRLVSAPDCTFAATLEGAWADALANDGFLEIEATPIAPLPPCASNVRNGAAIVARVPLSPRSIAERLRQSVARLLQDRLPFETET